MAELKRSLVEECKPRCRRSVRARGAEGRGVGKAGVFLFTGTFSKQEFCYICPDYSSSWADILLDLLLYKKLLYSPI